MFLFSHEEGVKQLNLKIQSRQILPAVINLKQYSNDTYQLQYTLDTNEYDSVNLANLIPYAITSINDVIDETRLEKSYDSQGHLVITWNVMNFSTSQIGHVDYQIMFKDTDHVVWYSLKAMMIVSETIDADDHITANYPSLLRQWENYMDGVRDQVQSIVQEYTQGVIRITFTNNDARWVAGGVGYKLTLTNVATNIVNVYKTLSDGNAQVVLVGISTNDNNKTITIESFEKFNGFVTISNTLQV